MYVTDKPTKLVVSRIRSQGRLSAQDPSEADQGLSFLDGFRVLNHQGATIHHAHLKILFKIFKDISSTHIALQNRNLQGDIPSLKGTSPIFFFRNFLGLHPIPSRGQASLLELIHSPKHDLSFSEIKYIIRQADSPGWEVSMGNSDGKFLWENGIDVPTFGGFGTHITSPQQPYLL